MAKTVITEEQAKFLAHFNSGGMTIEKIMEKTGLDDETVQKTIKPLLKSGLLMRIFSNRTNMDNYLLLPLFPGIFELSFMRGAMGEKEKKLAKIFERVFDEMVPEAQQKYERNVKSYKRFPPFDRVIPVEEFVDPGMEKILPVEEVKALIEKQDIIALSTCYCRHEQDLLNNPCKLNASKDTCMFFGTTAEFFIEQEFAYEITKEKALEILKVAEDTGLVHKTFHSSMNPEKNEMAICSCCPCCCQIFGLHNLGVIPISSLTSYISRVDQEQCVGCGTCIDMCPTKALDLIDTVATLNEERCIGCGVCANHCPEKAITLERTGLRKVFIPPPKL